MNKRNQKILKIVFSTLIAIFVLLLAYFLFPMSLIIKRLLFPFIVIFSIIFLVLGVVLVYLTLKLKIKGVLKKFLILTGISAMSSFIFSLLHNLFYALEIIGKNVAVLRYMMEVSHISSFIIALIISPIGFLIGSIGSIILFKKKGGRHFSSR